MLTHVEVIYISITNLPPRICDAEKLQEAIKGKHGVVEALRDEAQLRHGFPLRHGSAQGGF